MRRLIFYAACALALLVPHGEAGAQTEASLFLDPAEQTVPLDGGPFEVRLMVSSATAPDGLGGYALLVNYDPTVLQALTVADSGFVESTGNAVVCPASGVDNAAGAVAQFCLTIPIFQEPGPQASEPQALAIITFEPAAEGTTALDITGTTISDPQGSGLLAETSNGSVTVGPPGAEVTQAEAPEDAGRSGGSTSGGNTAGSDGLPPLGIRGAERSGEGPPGALALLLLAGAALIGAGLAVQQRHARSMRNCNAAEPAQLDRSATRC